MGSLPKYRKKLVEGAKDKETREALEKAQRTVGKDGQTDAQRAADQEADIEKKQELKRKVGRGEDIHDILKSRQRAKSKRRGPKNLKEAVEDRPDD